jgi:ABC-type Fe3+/spermidine/putrescine transport system ATPase subunit
MPAIEVRDVTMRFGRILAVDRVTLTVDDGEYVTILGPSGCGKTSLIKIVSGIWTPTSGRVFVDGVDVTGVPPEERDLGFVFQNIVLFPHLSVWRNATYGPLVRDLPGEERDDIGREVLELVGMIRERGRLPHELSGGAQQKAALARALGNRAKLLLLDEPLSALDARVRVELRYALRRLVKDLGLTAIHVTHDQEEAMSVSDRVVVMRKGRVVESGSPEALYERPRTLFTANFVGENNFLQGSVDRLADPWARLALRYGHGLQIPADGLRLGQGVVVAIRPEDLRLVSEPFGNAVPGTVEGVRFMGSYRRAAVRLATEDVVHVDVSPSQSLNTRQSVMVAFDEDRLRVYDMPQEGLREAVKLE